MKEGWKFKKLGDVCGFVRGPFGGSLKKECFVEDGYAVYEQQHAIYNQFNEIRYFIDERKFNEMKRFELYEGDLIMSCSGTMGKVAIVPSDIKKGVINQALLKLTPKSNLNIEYLKYWMDSEGFKISVSNHSKGAAIKNVASVQILKTIELPCPSLSEQLRIVSLLNECFASIDQAKANLTKNLNNAKELFQSELNQIFSQKGEGWIEKKLNQISEVKDGTHDSPRYISKGIPFVTQKNIKEDGLTFENTKFITQTDHDKFYKRSNVAHGDILISMIGANRGMACIVNDERVFSIKNVGLFKASKNIDQQYLLYYLKSSFISNYVKSFSKGGAQEFIGLTELRNIPVIIAPSKEQQSIVFRLDSLSNQTKKLESIYQQKLNNLEELKKSILQKAFAGELKTIETEAMI